MAWGALITGIIVAGLSTGLQLLLQPTPPKQKIGGDAPNVPKSDYGKGIPLIYGRFKVSTNWIFPSKSDVLFRKEVSTESVGGGKGGGRQQVEKTEYFATFACLICEGPVELEAIYLNDNRYNPDSDVFQKYCTFFDGTQTEPWSVIETKDDQPENEIIYKDLAYIGFEDLPENYFDYKVDALVNSVNFPADPDLGDVVFDLCYRMIKHQVEQGKLPESDLLNLDDKIDVSELNNTQIKKGLFVERSSEGYREALQSLATLYLFTVVELKNGNLKFKLFQRPQNETVLHIPPEHFFPIEEGDSYNIYTRKPSPKEDQGLPSKIIFKYFHEPRYIEDQITEFFPFGEENNILNLSAPLGTYPYHARELIFNQQKFLAVWQKAIYEIIIPAFYYDQIDLLSLIQLPNGEIVQIYDVSSGNDYLLRITASSYGGNLSLDYSGLEDGVGQENNYTSPVIPAVYVLDIRQIEDYPPTTLYVLATTANTLRVSLDGGITTNATVNHLAPSTIGNCLTVLPNNGGGLDVVNYLDIELESGSVEGISQEQFDNPSLFNLALLAVEQPDGYYNGKFIQFRDVQVLGNNQYRLSYIFQGWYDSQFFDTSSFPLKFFLLKGNGAYYSLITGNSRLIGQSITVTPIVSPAQDIGTTPTTVFTPSGNSYQPTAISDLQAQEDGDGNIRLSWEYIPPVSSFSNQTDANSISFDVVIGNNVRTIHTLKKTVIYLISDRTADSVTKPFEVTVYAINNIFGRGTGTTLTVNTTPINGTVFGTGEDGFKGIKTITNDAIAPNQFSYTVTEDDNNWILLVINPNVTYSDLEFPDSLSNGFTCQVVADGNSSDINSRVRFIVNELLQPDDNLDILAGSTVTVTHAGSGKYSILGNNRKYLQVNSDNSIAVTKTWNFLAKNLGTANQSINIEYLEDFGDRSNIIFSIVDAYIDALIANSPSITALQALIDDLEQQVLENTQDIFSLEGQVSQNTQDILDLQGQIEGLDAEGIQDMLSTFLVAGTNISLNYNDTGNTLTINSTASGEIDAEIIQDMLSTFLVAGTNVSLDYNDTNNTLTINSTASANVDNETIQDMLSTFLVEGTNVTFDYDDTANTLTINALSAVANGSDLSVAEFFEDGNIANTTKTEIVVNRYINNVILFNNSGSTQTVTIYSLVNGNSQILAKTSLLSKENKTININLNYTEIDDGIEIQCGSGNVNYFVQSNTATTQFISQGNLANNVLSSIFTATDANYIVGIKLYNANANPQLIKLYLKLNNISLQLLEKTIASEETFEVIPDYSFNLADTDSINLQCALGNVNYFVAGLGDINITPPPSTGDPYESNVVLYLKGDGLNGSTTIIDSSSTPKTITNTNSVIISTAQGKYGGSSIYFNNNYLSVPIADFAELWTNVTTNYTVEAWVNVSNFSVARGILDARQGGSEGGELRIQTTGKLFFYNTGGLTLESTLAITANTWNHVALIKNNSVVTLFVNGVASGSKTWANRTVGVTNLRIGGSSSNMLGYIDSLRITKGIARYTTNFNPETDTYLAY